MGLFGWAKRKFYDYRLKKADKLVLQSRFSKAENIYRGLFGKHRMAVVNLAKMLVDRSDNVNSNLSALKSIVDLKEYTDSDNYELYNFELESQIMNIEDLSTQKFNVKQYHESALLIDAIRPNRKNDILFLKRCNQIHAYLSFSEITQSLDYHSSIEDTIRYLKLYGDSCKSDINLFIDELVANSYYSRAVKLLLPFLSLDKRFEEKINNIIVEIVKGRDKDFVEPQKLTDFCPDKKTCLTVADYLYNLSIEAAKKKDFSLSVLFDSFAAEFLSSDNNFNVTRCFHVFKELEGRANFEEIKKLLELARTLKISDKQIGILKKDIASLASKVEPQKGIEICRLFLSERDFGLIYIEQAKKLASSKTSFLDVSELLTVIQQITDNDTFVDELSSFVQFIPEYEEIFVNAAIDKILRLKSIALLMTYWRIYESASYFNGLISPSSELFENTVRFIIDNNELFLHSDCLLTSFLSALDGLNNNDYAYQVAENLHLKGCDVLAYYLDKARLRCDNLPDTKRIDLIDHTLSVIDYLHIYQSTWIPLFLMKRGIQEKSISTLYQRAAFYKETIDTIINSSIDFRDISESSYLDLWQEYTNIILKRSESQPKEKAVQDMTKVRGLIANYCKAYSTYMSLCDSITTRISKLRFEIAKEQEEDCDYENAIKQYHASIQEADRAYKTKANYRRLICFLKSNHLSESIEEDIKNTLMQNSHKAFNDDLAYRYACFLLKSIRPSEAQDIIEKYLPTENFLQEMCKNVYIIESEQCLDDFNSRMLAVAEGTLSLQDAMVFLNDFAQYKLTITRNLTDTINMFVSYRRKLETYVVKLLFNENQYSGAFPLLLKIFPNFYDDSTHFRNIAIAALGIIEDEESPIDESRCKYAIAIWISAVFNDKLFVESLENTLWDDQYTFTLVRSFGCTSYDDYECLPDNINFDEPIENQNIAIADTQNHLISRVEIAIRNKYPQLEQFFNSEKEALEELISLDLDEECIVASPYLAQMHGRIFESIQDAMDYEYTCEYGNEEKLLSLGVRYGFDTDKYADYKNAYDCVERCKRFWNGPRIPLLALISVIKKYDGLFASLKAFFSSRMNEDIKSKMNYKEFIDTYEVICNALHDETLSFAFSQYANGAVVHLLNNNTMKLRDGVGYMVRIYSIAPSSIQVKENLEGMLCNLASSCAESSNVEDEQVLATALLETGSTFKSKVEDARIQGILSAIIDKVNNHVMTKATALEEVYGLYKKNPNNDRICKNLVTLCDMCIMEYIIERKYGYANVRKTLNELNNNKSVTYDRHANKLVVQLMDIWKELPQETRMTLKGVAPISTTLTPKGEALKEGLEFYKRLGNYSHPLRDLLSPGLMQSTHFPYYLDYP